MHFFFGFLFHVQKEVSLKDLLGPQPVDIIRDAVEEIISIIKDEQLRDPERHYEISKLLTGKPPPALTNERYAQFVAWGKKINDFHRTDDIAETSTSKMGEDEQGEGGINDEMGVAVVFDESDEERSGEEDASDIGDEVVEIPSSSDDEEEEEEEDNEEKRVHKPKQDILDLGEDIEDVVAHTKEQQDVEEDSKRKRSGKGTISNNNKKKRRLLEESNILDENENQGASTTSSEISIQDIDAHWLQRQLTSAKFSDDATLSAKVADDILNILEVPDVRECENKLLLLLGFDWFDFIRKLTSHRLLLWACIKLKRARDDTEKQHIEDTVKKSDLNVWHRLYSKESVENWTQDRMTRTAKETKKEAEQLNVTATEPGIISALKDDDETDNRWDRQKQQQDLNGGSVPSELDLDALAFTSGGHFMSNKKCDLPEGSWRAMRKGYEEVHVPAIRSIIPKDEKLIEISDLPPWTHAAFQGMDKLNRVQSKMYEAALYTSENLLLCAPTGAGKTNVAMLAVLNTLAQYKREGSGDSSVEFDLQGFKVVYVAPMKALVQEVVKNFGSRLSKYGITVKELR